MPVAQRPSLLPLLVSLRRSQGIGAPLLEPEKEEVDHLTHNGQQALDRPWWSGTVLPLALLLSFAIAVGVGVYTLTSLRTVLVQERGTDLGRTAARVASTLDRVLFERFSDIQVFANDRILFEGKLEEKTERLLQYKKRYRYYSWVGVTDATGQIVVATQVFALPKTGGMTETIDRADDRVGFKQPDWFTMVKQTGRVYLEEARPSAESQGMMAVGFSAPIFGPQGDFRGVVRTQVPIENLRTILEEEGKLQNGEETHDWLLLDRQGALIIEKRQTIDMKSSLSTTELLSARKAAEDRQQPGFVEELHQRRQIPVVTGFARTQGYGNFPGFDWTVLVRLDREHVDAPINRLMWTVAGVGLLLVLPLAGFGVWASWRLVSDNRDLALSRTALEKSITELARSNADLQQFAYVASHDLKEPLRMVASYTQLLARRYKGRLDSDAEEFIKHAVDGANRMQSLINDLLTYSRVTVQNKVFEDVDCNGVLKEVLNNLQVAVEETQAVVTHGSLPRIMADRVQLGQLFQNLLGNAIKFHGKEAPLIHVAAEQRHNEWLFSVRDNGVGLDPQYAERIFVIFDRLAY